MTSHAPARKRVALGLTAAACVCFGLAGVGAAAWALGGAILLALPAAPLAALPDTDALVRRLGS